MTGDEVESLSARIDTTALRATRAMSRTGRDR